MEDLQLGIGDLDVYVNSRSSHRVTVNFRIININSLANLELAIEITPYTNILPEK
jgi:hypothetical protein